MPRILLCCRLCFQTPLSQPGQEVAEGSELLLAAGEEPVPDETGFLRVIAGVVAVAVGTSSLDNEAAKR